MNPCDPIEGNARAAYLDTLYLMDGRDYPKHPLHGHYTGLVQERAHTLLAFDRKLFATPGLKGASVVVQKQGDAPYTPGRR